MKKTLGGKTALEIIWSNFLLKAELKSSLSTALSSWVLNISSEADCTACLAACFQCSVFEEYILCWYLCEQLWWELQVYLCVLRAPGESSWKCQPFAERRAQGTVAQPGVQATRQELMAPDFGALILWDYKSLEFPLLRVPAQTHSSWAAILLWHHD